MQFGQWQGHWVKSWAAWGRILFVLLAWAGVGWSQTAAKSAEAVALFSRHCAVCHGDAGQGESAVIRMAGPSLQAVHNPGLVMLAMETGPSRMPRFETILTVPQMRMIARFVTRHLAVIPLTGGSLGRGGDLYRVNCASCHGAVTQGGTLGFAGLNAPALRGKPMALVAGAIRWGPGPMPRFSAAELPARDVASIAEYVRYLRRPSHPGGAALHWNGPVPEGAVAWAMALSLMVFAIWLEKGGRG